MAVPFIDLTRQIAPLRAEIDSALARVVASGRFILGPEVEGLEREMASFVGAAHAVGTASGTDALLLSLKACGVRPGDTVVTAPFSFFATAAVIIQAGAKPAFVDVDRKTMNMDAAALEDLLSSARGRKVRAVMPVHLFGLMADMKRIRNAADRRGIPVVEDACQAIGSRRDGLQAGACGMAAGFSFFPTKNLGAFGDGGLATTSDAELAAKVRRLRNHGSSAKNVHDTVGVNGRLDEIQAAVLRVKLGRLEAWNQRRREHAARYTQALKGRDDLVCPFEPEGATHIYHQYTIRLPRGRRDEMRAFLQSRGVGTDVYYPTPIHLQPGLKGMGFRRGMYPQAERCAKQVLSLPVFPELTAEEQGRVIEAVLDFAPARSGAAPGRLDWRPPRSIIPS